MTKKAVEIDKKQKDTMLKNIFKDHPELNADSMKLYIVERLIEAYLTDPDGFNRRSTELKKKAKKGEIEPQKKIADEIIAITKVEAEEKPHEPEKSTLQVNEQGLII